MTGDLIIEGQRWRCSAGRLTRGFTDDLITSSFFLIVDDFYVVDRFPPCSSFFMIALHVSLLSMVFPVAKLSRSLILPQMCFLPWWLSPVGRERVLSG
jgi:hypothetical protein